MNEVKKNLIKTIISIFQKQDELSKIPGVLNVFKKKIHKHHILYYKIGILRFIIQLNYIMVINRKEDQFIIYIETLKEKIFYISFTDTQEIDTTSNIIPNKILEEIYECLSIYNVYLGRVLMKIDNE